MPCDLMRALRFQSETGSMTFPLDHWIGTGVQPAREVPFLPLDRQPQPPKWYEVYVELDVIKVRFDFHGDRHEDNLRIIVAHVDDLELARQIEAQLYDRIARFFDEECGLALNVSVAAAEIYEALDLEPEVPVPAEVV